VAITLNLFRQGASLLSLPAVAGERFRSCLHRLVRALAAQQRDEVKDTEALSPANVWQYHRMQTGRYDTKPIVHERHVPMICELPTDFFACEFRVTGRVCPGERNGVRILGASGDLHFEDDPGEIVSFGTSGSKLDLRRKCHEA